MLRKRVLSIAQVFLLCLAIVCAHIALAAPVTMEWLYHYIRQGNIYQLSPYFHNSPTLEVTDRRGNTALCQAVINQDIMMVKKLLYLGANRNARCMQSIPPETLRKMGFVTRPTYSTAAMYTPQKKKAAIIPSFFKNSSFLWFLLLGGAVGAVALASGGGGGGNSIVPIPPAVDPEKTILPPTTTIPAIPYPQQCPEGMSLINGVCTTPISKKPGGAPEDGKTPISVKSDTSPYQLAEFGGSVSNNEDLQYSGSNIQPIVAMQANGVSLSALQGDTVYLSGASSATNEQGGTISMQEVADTNEGVIALYGTAAGTINNNGDIDIISKSHAESAGLKVPRNDAASIYGTGQNITNNGTITVTDMGDGMGVLSAVSAPGRSVTNNGTVNIKLNTNGGEIDKDTKGIAHGIYGKNVSNQGTISLSTNALGNNTAINTDAYLIRTYGDEGSIAANDGTLNIELTNIAWNIYGVWSDASAEAGSTVKNTGTINVTGKLYNDNITATLAKQVYIVGTNGGITNIKNIGNIKVGTKKDPIDVTDGGFISALYGGHSGTMENLSPLDFHLKASPTTASNDFTALAMYLNDGTVQNEADINYSFTNTTLPPTASNQLIQLEAIRTVSASVENNATLTATLTGSAGQKSSTEKSYFSAITTSTGDIENTSLIQATSNMDNLSLTALKTGKGTMVNDKNARIILTTSGKNADLAGATATREGKGVNNGYVYLIHNGGSGKILGYDGGNNGFISIEAHDMIGESYITGGGTVGSSEEHESDVPEEATDEESDTQQETKTATNDSEGMINISLTGRTSGSVYGYQYFAGDKEANACTSANTINITADSTTRAGDLSVHGVYAKGPASLERNGTVTINVMGSPAYKTEVIGLDSINTSTTNNHASVVNVNVNLNNSTNHAIIGMKSVDSTVIPGNGTTDPTPGVNVDTSKREPIGYMAWNKGTLNVTVTGEGNNTTYDSKIPFDVVGIATNAYALNTGTINLNVSSLTAKTAGMVAYDGGIIVNKNTISFTGNAANFTPLYATGVQRFADHITEGGTSEEVYSGYYWATIYNSGTIIINNIGSERNPQGNGYYSAKIIEEDEQNNPLDLWAHRTKLVNYTIDPQTKEREIVNTQTTNTTGNFIQFGSPETWAEIGEDIPARPRETVSSTSSNITSTASLSTSKASMRINNGMRYVSESGGSFVANDVHLSGDITAGTTIVQGSNADTYVADGFGMGAIIGDGDASDLTLVSNSVLFRPSYAQNQNFQNGIDIVMTRKSFHELIADASLATFLEQNYKANNNVAFFDLLKSFGSQTNLTKALNKLTGKEMLSRLNFEDINMMKEINFDMNQKLFQNKKDSFMFAGSVSPMTFKSDKGSATKYSLLSKRHGNVSIGLGVAFSNLRSSNANKQNKRQEMLYQMVVPIGFKNHGFHFITSPRLGYAKGTYNRLGFNDKTYKGTIEKKVFGLTNELRYPIALGTWSLEPTAELNLLGYTQRGSEDHKEYSLNIKSQTNYSLEQGVGLHLNKQTKFTKGGILNLSAGVMAYHEFADPYQLRVGMTGMSGSFTLRDEKRSQNHTVLKAGLNYETDRYAWYNTFMSYIDDEIRSSVKSSFKLQF